MLRAGMPEAAIDENCNARPRENDVRSAPEPGNGRVVDPIAKPSTMQLASQGHLGSGVPASVREHRCARVRRGGLRCSSAVRHRCKHAPSRPARVRPPPYRVSAEMSNSVIRRTAVPNHRGTALRLPASKGSPDPGDLGAVRRWVADAPRPRAIDLFCGAGGLSLGLRDAGFSVLVGADADPWAVQTHTGNLGGLGYVGDLSDPADLLEQLDGWGIDHVELVAGGVPCQPFSRAGRSKLRELIRTGGRHPQDPRALLWRSFMQVVETLRPDAVLVENVPDLPSWDDGAVLSGFQETLDELGYNVDARILDCYRFGVPQHRSRLVLVGLSEGRTILWPEPSDEIVTLRDAIGDLPPVPGGQRAERLPYRARPAARSSFQERMRRDVSRSDREWIHDHITRAVRADDWEAYAGLQPGQTYADMPARLQRYRTDIFTDKYKRLAWHELSRTITAHIAKDGYWYIHPEQHRTLSIREAARLQTFPDSFRFAGQPSHRFTQIGNAVPPVLGEAVGGALARSLLLDQRATGRADGPRSALLNWYHGEPQHPWRRPGADPWEVLAAELALERSSMADLEARFESLTIAAPSPVSLSTDVTSRSKLESAGLSRHATDALLAAAAAISELFDGEVPDDDLALRAIPNVGESVAKMVLCFGYGRKAVPLHSAAARVVARVTGRSERRRWQLRLDLHRLAGPTGPDAEFNAAVIHLGTATCRPVQPRCTECPLRSVCRTGSAEAGATHPTSNPEEVVLV
jgi:DNA (cytosine-5)-methyltransferase 1